MKPQLIFAYPGNLQLNTGGYAYDRRVIAGLAEIGWDVKTLPLGEGFPFPTEAQKRAAETKLSALSDDALVMIDGLAFGVLDQWARREAERLKIVALVHHPLALETGLEASMAEILRESETTALSFAREVIVTSPATARELSTRYGVEEKLLTVSIPGTDRAPLAAGLSVPPHILSVGTLISRKGHDILLGALKEVEDLDWTATIIGSRTLDADVARQLQQQCSVLGLDDRVTFAGECRDTREQMAKASIFALASRYEGFGMVFAEALSQGLPIVACRAGAIPEVVPADAGILVPVDDIEAFAAALRSLLENPDDRRRFAKGARAAGAALPGWEDTARVISNTLERAS